VPEELKAKILETAQEKGRTFAARENWRWHLLFDRDRGLYGDRPGNPWRMRTRQWIERFVVIEDKAAHLGRMTLNPAQRKLLADIYRMIRANVPVHLIILKARQIGFSTFIQALAEREMLTRSNFKARLMAHLDDTSKEIFEKVGLMSSRIAKDQSGESFWQFDMPQNSAGAIKFGPPIFSAMRVDSAQKKRPAHGTTAQLFHGSEVALWPNAEQTIKGVGPILPSTPDTFYFDESTADGDSGFFRDKFWAAWKRVQAGARPGDGNVWAAFFPWFNAPEYRWSRVHGRPLPPELAAEIEASLETEESWLLEQPAFERKVGWRTVDYDQIAWRRWMLANKCGREAPLDFFHEQYPGRPEHAFLASGRPFFDHERLGALRDLVREPVWIGDLVPAGPEKTPDELVPWMLLEKT